jgi:hypothetical protein
MFVLTCVQPALQAVSLMTGFRLTLKLTPHGRLVLEESSDVHELAPELGKRLQEAFSRRRMRSAFPAIAWIGYFRSAHTFAIVGCKDL